MLILCKPKAEANSANKQNFQVKCRAASDRAMAKSKN